MAFAPILSLSSLSRSDVRDIAQSRENPIGLEVVNFIFECGVVAEVATLGSSHVEDKISQCRDDVSNLFEFSVIRVIITNACRDGGSDTWKTVLEEHNVRNIAHQEECVVQIYPIL